MNAVRNKTAHVAVRTVAGREGHMRELGDLLNYRGGYSHVSGKVLLCDSV